MLQALWLRLFGKVVRASPATQVDDLYAKARTVRAAARLREILRQQAKSADFTAIRLPALVRELRALTWSDTEIAKVCAYAEFFAGNSAQAYERVVQGGLAQRDYTLFMTACVHCYLADRFSEAAVLLEVFQPDEDPATDWAEYLAYAGYIYFAAGRPIEQALACFDRALEAGYFSPLLAVNAYPIYFESGRLEECQKLKQLIQAKCPDDPEAIYALAGVELARNFYAEGFRLMESRYRMPEADRYINARLLTKSRWAGQDLAGKWLLVHGEQGIGDMIMMLRYLPLLKEKGATLILDGRAEAQSLVEHNFPYCKFLVGDVHSPVVESFDYWIGLMSLPYHFQTTVMNVPAVDGYLSVPEEQSAYWSQRVDSLRTNAALRVGLTWSGNPGHRADKRRSMSFERISAFIRKHPDVYFFSLQTSVPTSRPHNLVDIADELLTLADTAAVIAEMDLVISVDTSAVHLAGALGRPTWLLLPYRYEWRWGLEGMENAWYRSVKVWRQSQFGAWTALLDDVSQALRKLTSKARA